MQTALLFGRWPPLVHPAIANAEKICPLVKKLLAAKDDDFLPFKGEEIDKKNEHISFKGLLTPDVAEPAKAKGCTLIVRRRFGDGSELQPNYTCSLAWGVIFEKASAAYEAVASAIRECFPGMEFIDTRTGSVEHREEIWSLKSESDGAEILMELSDIGATTALLLGTNPSDEPAVSVNINIYNNSPMRPDLNFEIPVMKSLFNGD